MIKIKTPDEKKFIITGFYDVEERDSQKQQHGILVVTGGKDMKIVEVTDEE